jgi:hypothetical protein
VSGAPQSDTGQFSQGLTFGDIHRAIDLIRETLHHYNRLILGSTTAGSVTMPPWEAGFTVAWLPNDEAWHQVAEIMQGTTRADWAVDGYQAMAPSIRGVRRRKRTDRP